MRAVWLLLKLVVYELWPRWKAPAITVLLVTGSAAIILITRGAVREHKPNTVLIETAERCTFTGSTASGHSIGTLYIEKDANRARADVYTTYEGVKQGDHFIMYPGWIYAWQDGGKEGIAVELIANADPKAMFTPLTKFNCNSWASTNTPFILPDGIMYRHVNKEEAVHYFESRNLIGNAYSSR